MTELSTDDTPVAATRSSRPTVTASAVAAHLAMTRQNVVKLADVDHVIERLPDCRVDLNACRFPYLKWLRDPTRRSARSEAEAKYADAKTQLLHIRIEEKQRKLVRREDVDELLDAMAGTVLTHLSGAKGSAKSTFSAILRALLDPNTAPLRALPREDRDLCSPDSTITGYGPRLRKHSPCPGHHQDEVIIGLRGHQLASSVVAASALNDGFVVHEELGPCCLQHQQCRPDDRPKYRMPVDRHA
jgi:hypothetical protein